MSVMTVLVLMVLAALGVGSLPTRLVVSRIWRVDLFDAGTGNAGAGNATRSIGLKAGATVAVLDGFKGLIPILVSRWLGLDAWQLVAVGIASVGGNDWPLPGRRRGGRGLATSVGVVVGAIPGLVWWPGVWSVIGWKVGGGIAGFMGWGLLAGFAVAVGAPGWAVALSFALGLMMAVRRGEGNAGWERSGVWDRILFDRDPRPVTRSWGDTEAIHHRSRDWWWMAGVVAFGIPLYLQVMRWAFARSNLGAISLVGWVLLVLAVVFEFAAKWEFGRLFQDGVARSGGTLSERSAFRAALVGSGVARLIPAGGAITPLAMAWSVRRESPNATGAALRATVLNYGGLTAATGLGMTWVAVRFPSTQARMTFGIIGSLLALFGFALVAGSARLGALSRAVPARFRDRMSRALVEHTVDRRTLWILSARVVLEAAVLGVTMRAFNLHLTPSQTIAAFGFSQLVGGLPGTPGGLGLTEAGLTGALTFFGFPAAAVLGPVLVFRLVSYWAPALAGLVAGGTTFFSKAEVRALAGEPMGETDVSPGGSSRI
jgi:acyl-phosphate glycerol 3-phosphate acyltransferase